MKAAIQILVLGVRFALTPAVAAAPLPLPDYSGVWTIDRELSDDPSQALKEWRDSSSPPSSSGGSHGHGRGHGHGGGGGGSAGDDAQAQSADPRGFAALDTLTIRHSEPEITIVDATGRERRLTTDGKKIEEEHSHGGTTKVSAAWTEEGRLQIVSVPEHGPKWTETFAIAADRSQLIVTTKIERSHGTPLTIRRVYDSPASTRPAAPPDPAPPAGEPDDDSVSARR